MHCMWSNLVEFGAPALEPGRSDGIADRNTVDLVRIIIGLTRIANLQGKSLPAVPELWNAID
jgi:hypothetical protein